VRPPGTIACATLVTFVLAAPAGAFSGWHWSESSAEETLEAAGLPQESGPVEVIAAACAGVGYGKRFLDGTMTYRRFRCLVRQRAADGAVVDSVIRVAVTGIASFTWRRA
jgi:hypothetical protein